MVNTFNVNGFYLRVIFEFCRNLSKLFKIQGVPEKVLVRLASITLKTEGVSVENQDAFRRPCAVAVPHFQI